ncbi:hypothetical protein [Bradyrhizobium sp. 62]|uniref:hypothetical protein n=1 Tax=Bradyrhizobium sp. 62 TaxID=1043588 RepID=UPI001FF7800C|nr:hypothetical protein [Bradyrhizobium sp. 62]MCK1366384.1 hypothetical protein [Bradyrhizobium sp. 62]
MIDLRHDQTLLTVPQDRQLSNEQGSSTRVVALKSEIDYTDPAAVRDLICRTHPFGELLRYEGIVEACRLGQGRELVELSTPPSFPEPDEVSLSEVVDPPVDWIMSFENLERRAFVILKTAFFGVDEQHKQAILSVKDAGIVGHLAQANLDPPMKPKRHRRPRRRSQQSKLMGRKLSAGRSRPLSGQSCMPDLFKTFKG